MASFALYLFGMLVVTAGLAYAAWLVHVSTPWIVAGVIVLVGIGIMGGVNRTLRRRG